MNPSKHISVGHNYGAAHNFLEELDKLEDLSTFDMSKISSKDFLSNKLKMMIKEGPCRSKNLDKLLTTTC